MHGPTFFLQKRADVAERRRVRVRRREVGRRMIEN